MPDKAFARSLDYHECDLRLLHPTVAIRGLSEIPACWRARQGMMEVSVRGGRTRWKGDERIFVHLTIEVYSLYISSSANTDLCHISLAEAASLPGQLSVLLTSTFGCLVW